MVVHYVNNSPAVKRGVPHISGLAEVVTFSKYCFPHPSGLAGLLPQHPRTYMTAWRNREELEQQNLLKEVEAQEENS
jgi:hypothetical protein